MNKNERHKIRNSIVNVEWALSKERPITSSGVNKTEYVMKDGMKKASHYHLI